MTAETRDLADFWDRLKNVDWFYAMADDGRAYRRGRQQVEEAKLMAKELGPEAEAMYKAFSAHHHLKGGERPALPERPP